MWVKLSVLGNLTRVTYSSPNESPDQGEEGRSQMIGWDPKTEVAPSSRQRKKEIRKSVFGHRSWRTNLKPRLRVKEDEGCLGQEGVIPSSQD